MKYLFIVFLFLLGSCIYQTPEKKSVQEMIEQELNLEMFEFVIHKNDSIPLKDFLKKHKYKSIVYLKDDYSPCYDKYIKWHKEISKLNFKSSQYSILFIITGKYVDDFLYEVNLIQPVTEKYYIVMDPNFYYPDGNNIVPNWMLEYPILIDDKNRIKMVGQPFGNTKQLKKFEKIVSN